MPRWCIRIFGLIYKETCGVLKVFLENIIRDAATYTEHTKRKIVTAMDVFYALKRQERTLKGSDLRYCFRFRFYNLFPLNCMWIIPYRILNVLIVETFDVN